MKNIIEIEVPILLLLMIDSFVPEAKFISHQNESWKEVDQKIGMFLLTNKLSSGTTKSTNPY